VKEFPEWWDWELFFTPHAEKWITQRGLSTLQLRAMLERATRWEPDVIDGRFKIYVHYWRRPWIVIVEPDAELRALVVVTTWEIIG